MLDTCRGDWRIPTRDCVASWGWFGLGFGIYLIFFAVCGVIVLQGGGSDSAGITEYRSGLTGQLLSRTGGGPNPHLARDHAFAPIMLAGGVIGLLLIPAGIYVLRFSVHMPAVWPRTWSGKPAVLIENLCVPSQSSSHMATLTLIKPLPKKLKDALIRCVYLYSDAWQPTLDMMETRFDTDLSQQAVVIPGVQAQVVRSGNTVCGFVVDHIPTRGLGEGWPMETSELQIPFFPAELEKLPSYLKPADREKQAAFVREAWELLARGDGRLFVAMLIYGPGETSKIAVSNTVTADV